MKNILLLVHDDAGQEARIQVALDLARAIGGHIHCVEVTEMPVPLGTGFETGFQLATLIADEYDRETVNRDRITERFGTEDVSWSWEDRTGGIAASMADASALADIIIVNRELADFPMPAAREIAGDVALRTGLPVLAVPDDIRAFDAGGTAIVAWDGSAVSEKALRAAVPLLALAGSVCILSVGELGKGIPAEDAALYLSRHDIHADVRNVEDGGATIASVLRRNATSLRASYIVMGAYGHRRLLESLFGGVTRTLLKESPVPLLLVH